MLSTGSFFLDFTQYKLLFSFITACSSSCLNASEGLGLCTTEKESDCCNFYDTTDRCVSQCGDNQEPNEQFECQCVPFWSGLECNGNHICD